MLFLVAGMAFLMPGCRGGHKPVVVVYTALDRMFSEPILDEFTKRTGNKVMAKYDTEATKTVGLVNAIRSEKGRPRGDVFWNNAIVTTIRLKEDGLLAQHNSRAAAPFPATFKDPDGYWVGFAARARVLIVNTNLVGPERMPDSIRALADPAWRGKVGIAKPLFGTTATHAACLFAHEGDVRAREFFQSLKDNDIQIQSGNKSLALNVAAGRLAFGLTDTDDAIIEMENGQPVTIVYPDAGSNQVGVLFIPNTLALIKGAPNAVAGRQLIEYLLSPEVEMALAASRSAQIPLNPDVHTRLRVRTPADVKAMDVDFSKASACFNETAEYVSTTFLR